MCFYSIQKEILPTVEIDKLELKITIFSCSIALTMPQNTALYSLFRVAIFSISIGYAENSDTPTVEMFNAF